ncbi:insulinase family protein [Actinomycetaceae bacterium TAE3-ERU4]|nr:insulinase family protein [Actinomycetaceae bacterium TAE3-ERU4]
MSSIDSKWIELPCLPPSDSAAEISFNEDGSLIRRSVLPGGVRVLTQSVPATRSVALGCWLPVGSRDEAEGHYGSTHFLEHLLFKGTAKRTALEIASAFEEVGGQTNASTSQDYTNYYARILAEDLPMAVTTLLDMVTGSLIDEEQMQIERGVILEELASAEDDPVGVLFDEYSAVAYAGSPLGRPVGGTAETVNAITREAIWEHYKRTYRSSNLVVTAAGKVDHDELCAMVLSGLQEGGWDTSSDLAPAARRSPDSILQPQSTRVVKRKKLEQAQVAVGTRSLPMGHELRWPLRVMVAVLGSGMSSRLFQEIREKRGLAYTTFAFNHSYTEAGAFGMYAGCKPQNVSEVVDVMTSQWELLASEPPAVGELERILGQTRGSLALGMEDNFARMYRLGRAEVCTGHLTLLADQLESVAAVTPKDVQEVAANLLEGPRLIVSVEPEESVKNV